MIPNIFLLIAAGAVLTRCVCVSANINWRDWNDGFRDFAGIAIGYAITAGGSLAVAFSQSYGGTMLLLGFALLVLFERRQYYGRVR